MRGLRILFFILCPHFLSEGAFAQSNLRAKEISFSADTIRLDTLSIIPGTVLLKNSAGADIDTSQYSIDYASADLILRHPINGTGKIAYRVFPFLLSKTFQHKDKSNIQRNMPGETYVYTLDKKAETDFFKTEGLSKSGSISRGISFGNAQDVVLNSNLNLQLAGKLSDNMDILLAATDQNIPIQPEGNTQQLQEFDKVFIQIGIKDLPENGKTIVTAGDFILERPKGYFMNYNKKLQGLSFESRIQNPESGTLTARASAAVSKGKFAKNSSAESANGNTFNGQKQERNQGPYKLRGAENEQFIIVLAGTEKIYLDGELLERGQENDYVIDYNTAEIVFTPKNLITKDKRIAAEFQYSDKNYARSLIQAGTEYETKKVSARINIFSEQDNKNRPLQQDLSEPQKLLLASIGDTLQNALWASADSVAFNGAEVLYDKRDTTVGSKFYSGIFVYSTDSTKAHYRLSFSFVETNKGNYRVKQAAANGRVYEWVLPDTLTNEPRGSYEPVILLVTPKQKKMVTAGADILLSKNSKLSFEGAASKNDINRYSPYEKADDDGFGGKVSFENKIPLSTSYKIMQTSTQWPDSVLPPTVPVEPWTIISNVNYEFIQKTFSAIERFRSVEFERDWNRGSASALSDQNIFGGRIGIARNQNLVAYDYKSFLEGSFYAGMKHGATINLAAKGFSVNAGGGFLDSKSQQNRTNFLRQHAAIAKEFKINSAKLRIGLRQRAEENLVMEKTTNSLLNGSLRFYEREPFAEFTDSAGNKYNLFYKQRMDYGRSLLPQAELHRSTFAESYGGGLDLMSNPNSMFRINGSYRKLEIVDSTITSQKPENTIIGRMEYTFTLLKGFFSSNTFYEIGSGLEVKKEFIFIEVAPGQGTHIWTDYNGNGIRELNEFEISPFPHEANFIKVWTPTDNYISAYTNQLSEVFTIKPAARWSAKKGMKKFISRFSNQTAYRTDRKTTNEDLSVAYNPFYSDTKDKTLVTLNSSLRNTVYFNQTDPVLGMDYTWQDARTKTLLENDTTSRENYFNEVRLRWNMNSQWTLQNLYKRGVKSSQSEFFISRNFNILFFEAEPKLSWQPSPSFRLTASYKYANKKNEPWMNPTGEATIENFGAEVKYNTVNKGSLTAKTNFILIAYSAPENTPLAFEMLEGLKTGKNYTWNIGYSRTLASNIQLTLSYDGRQSPGIKPIHTGNAQVRAFF